VRELSNVSWKDVRNCAKRMDGFSWLPYGHKTDQLSLKCQTHSDCKVVLCVKKIGDCGIILANDEPHAAHFSTEPYHGRGPGGEFADEIRQIAAGGHGAKHILIELKERYGKRPLTMDKAKFERIPSLASIQSFLGYNCSSRSFLLNNADLLGLCVGKRVGDYAAIQQHALGDMLVVHEFCREVKIQLFDEDGFPTGETQPETTLGIIFASRKQLEWLRRFYLHNQALEAMPTPPPGYTWVVQADGTYRLVKGTKASGAVLVDLGIHDIKYDSAKDKDVHTFIPLLYMYVQCECFEAYLALFQTFRHLPTTHLGLPGCQIRPEYGSLDRAAYIAKAFAAVWPEETY
jgi:hypothetical protein